MSQICEQVAARFQEALLYNFRQMIGPLVKEIFTPILPEILFSINALPTRSLDASHPFATKRVALTQPATPMSPVTPFPPCGCLLRPKEGEKLCQRSLEFLRIPDVSAEKPGDRNKAALNTVLDILEDIGADGVPVYLRGAVDGP